ncbi:uncharacterized protein LOC127160213 isoform X2 [Labeo rohita]|uniref:uncharacterized protein LOC127160213 isoform X1 n=1 Tax=Labeo rohita TaxID=84645 RepID=UPI0021E2B104|nr:uncharacterized protein LOC127160213 isoform X1 [Labeo rohita]XP_050958831.1 uncharacterized protein LOC127160213 isoform X2 [Labeo rohita]
MASVVPLRGLVIFLCLLHLCVQGIQDVNTVCLAKMTQYFYDKVQPKTKEGADAQYALSIYLPPAYCVDSKTEIKNKFDNDDAAQVKALLNKGAKCVLCTEPKNVIASRPVLIDKKNTEHSEHVLLYPVGKSPMDKLLAKTREKDSCVVFYSYNSPCVKTCLQSADNILEGLRNWINKRKGKMNAFVFQEIWQKDIDEDLETEFKKIDAIVPLYRCMRNSQQEMKCRKCVDNNVVVSFCLPNRK